MRVLRWAVAAAALGVLAGFAAGLMRPHPVSDYHPGYDVPPPRG